MPKYSRFLRFSAVPAHRDGGETKGQVKRPLDVGDVESPSFLADSTSFEVAFGLPWTCESFISQACKTGHPALKEMGVPPELAEAVSRNVQWTDLQMSNFRIAWCRKWMKRAHELEPLERLAASKRHPAVAELTANKRLLLTEEMLQEIGYADVGALKLLSEGGTPCGGG